MQSLLMYKVKSVANARGQWGEAVPGLPTLFLGRGLWPAGGGSLRAPSLTSRSDRLQQRLPITQHFGQVSPLPLSANAHTWNYHQVLLSFSASNQTSQLPPNGVPTPSPSHRAP